jgi:UDP-4-amino-4-deoxy-L-arabinose formyltransferase/UDP-glucuronic acid dehydrogenase (UDP-4-keto-hexauronic acid decarboxylating)
VGRELNILLVAEESAGVQTLRALAGTGHRLVAVMSSAPGPATPHATVAGVAAASGHPRWAASEVTQPETAARVRAAGVDVLINVHSLFIVNSEVLNAPRIGSFNLHPGPLPGYAGLNAPSWAIYHGERQHGVTLHWMTPGIDSGPIAYAEHFPIDAQDTGLTVSAKCVRRGVPLVTRLVETAAADPDAIPAVAQDPTRRRYFRAGPPHDGAISWGVPARAFVDLVRACDYYPLTSPWGYPATSIGRVPARIVSASRTDRPCRATPGTVGEVVDDGIEVACVDEWVLVRRCQVDGRYVNARALLDAGND